MAADTTPTIRLPSLPDDVRQGIIHVGYSGGMDSTVLLHLLQAHAQSHGGKLRALHVHHGLHPQADAWSAHCQRCCDALGIPLRILRVQVRDDDGIGREAAARDARMSAFTGILQPGDVLALAHHRDDQAETFLLRALRASAVDGLAAMRAWRAFGDSWLWRPLLDVPRMQLRDYAQSRALEWIEDPGNRDTSLDRNYLRQKVMPLLGERWPHVGRALAGSAGLAGDAASLLVTEDQAALAEVRSGDDHALSIAALKTLPAARRARVLRAWIADCGLPPLPANGVSAIEADLLDAVPDRQAEFIWHGACIRHWRGQLHAGRVRSGLPADWRVRWDGNAPLRLPADGELRLEHARGSGFHAPIEVHARQGGERIQLPGRSHGHSLKQVLQDMGVPPWRRKRLPLLSDAQGTVLAAGDLVYSAEFERWMATHEARLVWNDDA